ncbi:hypothetical protein TWF281_006333 [Arthrobotrys megalospora]
MSAIHLYVTATKGNPRRMNARNRYGSPGGDSSTSSQDSVFSSPSGSEQSDVTIDTRRIFTVPFLDSSVAELADLCTGKFWQETNRMKGRFTIIYYDHFQLGQQRVHGAYHPSSPFVNHYETDVEELGVDFSPIYVYLELEFPWYFSIMNIVKSFLFFTALLMLCDFLIILFGGTPKISF